MHFYVQAGCEPEVVESMHPLGARVVTCHGDFHPSNYIQRSDGLVCVHLEFACVSRAVTDLAYCYMWLHGSHKRNTFAEASGETPSADDVAALRFDCEAAYLRVFHPAKLWGDFNKTKNDREGYWFDTYQMYYQVECQVRRSAVLRIEVLETGLLQCPAAKAAGLKVAKQLLQMSEWHKQEQEALVQQKSIRARASVRPALHGTEFCIRICDDSSLVLRVRPESDMIELASFTPDDAQQQWYRVGESIVHATTGLFLDTEVRYVVNAQGEPWETSSTRLCVRQQDGSDRQRWCLDSDDDGKHEGVIRHTIDGRVLTVNGWNVQSGQGVHVGVHVGHTQQWQMEIGEAHPASALPHAGKLISPQTYEILHQDFASLDCDGTGFVVLASIGQLLEKQLGRKCTEKDMETLLSDTLLSGDEQIDLDAYISWLYGPNWTVGIDLPATAQTAIPPEFDLTGEKEYIIKCSHPTEASDDAVVHDTEFCMQVFDHKVKCGLIDGGVDQRWKLVQQDGLLQITNVGNGECLHTDTKYISIHDQSNVWEKNHTDLVTKPADSSEQQQWLFNFGGPQEKRWVHKHNSAVEAWGDDDVTLSAGKCLRHFKDGRVVDVHGWQFKQEGNMGCGNSCHNENKGTSWILVDAASYNV